MRTCELDRAELRGVQLAVGRAGVGPVAPAASPSLRAVRFGCPRAFRLAVSAPVGGAASAPPAPVVGRRRSRLADRGAGRPPVSLPLGQLDGLDQLGGVEPLGDGHSVVTGTGVRPAGGAVRRGGRPAGRPGRPPARSRRSRGQPGSTPRRVRLERNRRGHADQRQRAAGDRRRRRRPAAAGPGWGRTGARSRPPPCGRGPRAAGVVCASAPGGAMPSHDLPSGSTARWTSASGSAVGWGVRCPFRDRAVTDPRQNLREPRRAVHVLAPLNGTKAPDRATSGRPPPAPASAWMRDRSSRARPGRDALRRRRAGAGRPRGDPDHPLEGPAERRLRPVAEPPGQLGHAWPAAGRARSARSASATG